jgi:peptide/nickel transport system permease protein
MVRYIIRRLLWVIVLLLVISAVTFVIFYALPSADPAVLRAGRQGSPELIQSIRHNLGLDQPIYVQYYRYMKSIVLHFDFGYSYQNNAPVRQQILDRLPATISLTFGAVLVWLAIGLPVGIISAVQSRTLLDRLTMGGALLAISAPVYWLGLVALYLFANDIGTFKIFPGAGSYVPLSENPGKWFGSLILPWLVLAAAFAAFYARLLRSNLIEVMN